MRTWIFRTISLMIGLLCACTLLPMAGSSAFSTLDLAPPFFTAVIFIAFGIGGPSFFEKTPFLRSFSRTTKDSKPEPAKQALTTEKD